MDINNDNVAERMVEETETYALKAHHNKETGLEVMRTVYWKHRGELDVFTDGVSYTIKVH